MTTAIAFTGTNQVEVVTVPDPVPGPGEFLVEATASLISPGTEGICLGRLFDPGTHWDQWVKYPFAPGYSLVGRVAAVGPEVTRVQVGDRVAVRKPHHSLVVVTADEEVYPIPDGVSDEDATWFHLATIAQVGVRRAAHQLGDRIAVVGLGPVGQLVTRYAGLSGGAHVIAVDPVQYRIERALAGGATSGLTAGIGEAIPAIRDLTGGGVDVLYDVTGAAPVLAAALPALNRFGRLVLLGDTGRPEQQHLSKDLIVEGLSVIGAHDMHGEHPALANARWNNRNMGELFFHYVRTGRMQVSDLVTHRFSPSDAPAAYDVVAKRDPAAMGLIFTWR